MGVIARVLGWPWWCQWVLGCVGALLWLVLVSAATALGCYVWDPPAPQLVGILLVLPGCGLGVVLMARGALGILKAHMPAGLALAVTLLLTAAQAAALTLAGGVIYVFTLLMVGPHI